MPHLELLAPRPRLEDLTARECEVLDLVAEGWSNARISRELWLSPKTVESHIRSVFLKLGLLHQPDVHRRVRAASLWLEARRRGPRAGLAA